MAEKHMNLFAVGDPDQSIYAFRGADIRNIMEFEADFPGTRVIPLEQNYRSTNTILRGSNAVIANNRERKPKELWSELGEGEPIHVIEVEDEHAEARFVAAEIARLVEEGFSGSEVAIFYRTNAQSRVLEDVLVRQAIQYQVIGGPRFYERAEIKDVIAYLQVIDNPYDAVSLMRIANKPRRGIGDTTIARLQTLRGRARDLALGSDRVPGGGGSGGGPAQGRPGVPHAPPVADGRRARADRARARRARPRAHRATPTRSRPSARSRRRAASRTSRSSSARRQEYQAAADEPSLSSFLQEISLFADQDAIRGEQSLVTLMTLHNAKGLEFRAVFMIGMEEGIFPHSRSIEEAMLEEERRLAYVGMTRAKERLDAHARLGAIALGLAELQPPVALHRRAARPRRRARAAPAHLLVELRNAAAESRAAH